MWKTYLDPVKILSLLFCFVVLALVSCDSSSEPPSQADEWTHTIELGTEYYKGGPQQGSPPDGQIPGGTKVQLLENAGSYSLIKAETGENGYVSTSVLKAIEK